jgi:mono/diheme cytochrome c family protein
MKDRKKLPSLAVLLVLAGGLATGPARAQPTPAATDPEVARGAVLYRIHCASCHGTAARGDGPVGPALRKKPADLTALARREGGRFPADRVRSFIDGRAELDAHGGREMPVWGLSFAERGLDASRESEIQAEIRALTRYIESLQRP